jgi:hypothetical protein
MTRSKLKTLLTQYFKAVFVSWVLRERANIRETYNYGVDAFVSMLGVILGVLITLLAPFVIPFRIILEWKRINHKAVSDCWNRWF